MARRFAPLRPLAPLAVALLACRSRAVVLDAPAVVRSLPDVAPAPPPPPPPTDPWGPRGALPAVSLAVGDHHACAALADGTVRCWGEPEDLRLGVDAASPDVVAVPGVRDAVQVAAGSAHTCARRRDGTLWCRGRNLEGQLGRRHLSDDTTPGEAPAAVPGLRGVAEVDAAYEHTCARLAGGAARCWGNNLDWELGDDGRSEEAAGPTRDRPTPVVGVRGVTALGLGERMSCFVAGADGELWCAGAVETLRALDDGPAVWTRATRVASWPPLRAVAVGQSHACGLARDGAVWCVGGARGTLLHTSSTGAVALQIPALSDVVALAGGGAVTCAVAGGDGRVRCWGAPDYDPWAPNAPSGGGAHRGPRGARAPRRGRGLRGLRAGLRAPPRRPRRVLARRRRPRRARGPARGAVVGPPAH